MRHATLVCALLVAVAVPARAQPRRPALGVMTFNLYLGADIEALFGATSAQDFVTALNQALASVVATDFPARAQVIAGEIADAAPDLVGLEEVARWNVACGGSPLLDVDFLATLEDALAAAGAHYHLAAATSETDLSAPPLPVDGCATATVRFTDRDVLLVRDDAGLRLSNVQTEHYHNLLTVPTPLGITVTVVRGYVAADVRRGSTRFRVIETHLESISDLYRDAQAAELLLGPALTPLPLVVLGDFNFTPDSPPWRSFRLFGFRDTWHALYPFSAGFTCCQPPSLTNFPSSLDERIDFVWTRGGFQPLAADLVGDDPADRTITPQPLWPSDHAGLFAALRPPFLPFLAVTR